MSMSTWSRFPVSVRMRQNVSSFLCQSECVQVSWVSQNVSSFLGQPECVQVSWVNQYVSRSSGSVRMCQSFQTSARQNVLRLPGSVRMCQGPVSGNWLAGDRFTG